MERQVDSSTSDLPITGRESTSRRTVADPTGNGYTGAWNPWSLNTFDLQHSRTISIEK
ncbi:hypothetical protein NJ7G_3004 [Natrinema sp. J7-2]|nr:hypothetical protein NJ7G_3004 [Natrinema sp. J7-2]